MPRSQPASESQVPADDPEVAEQRLLEQWLAKDAAFQLGTVEGLAWIDPYTGTPIDAPFGHREIALQHLTATRPWRSGKRPLPLAALLQHRWLLHLRDRINLEARYKYFGPPGWLNPYTNEWDAAVRLDEGRLTLATLQAMAQSLTRALGTRLPSLLPAADLERTQREANPPSPSADHAAAAASAPMPPLAPRVAVTASIVRPTATVQAPPPVPAARKQTEVDIAIASYEMTRARSVMDKVLRPVPTIPGLELSVEFHPAEVVGGDFYEFIPLADGRWFFALGDVSGHGAGAALVATSALKTLRYVVPTGLGLRETLARLNQDVRPDLPSGFFISMFAAVIDPKANELSCICVGHHAAVVASVRRAATLQRIGRRGPAIGLVGDEAFAAALHEERFTLEPGDRLVQFTDGMFEVNNAQGVEFGQLRTLGSCIANLEYPPAQMARRMVLEVKRFAGGQLPDDATVVAMHVGEP